jgi:hypothetical protein
VAVEDEHLLAGDLPAVAVLGGRGLDAQRPLASVRARVALVSPEAMPGSRSFLAASSPLWRIVLAASTTVEK